MIGTSRCNICHSRRPSELFVGKQGQRTKTCQPCRTRATLQDAVRCGRRPRPDRTRITIADHPRGYHPTTARDHGRAAYDDLHAACVKYKWSLGVDFRVNWCVRHDHEVRYDCDNCLREAVLWQSEWKATNERRKLLAVELTKAAELVNPRSQGCVTRPKPRAWQKECLPMEDELRIYPA